ncbi:hypothetical protein CDD81_196 [Ophiocordyceps australis]|uniref:Major facilitator superfamily (MFS) profile domain-containing protein n=1 Tax=Ophiocordyceps australis TaxID=1399860 RepID=A0A2C5YEU6_9HYPO|nr:hypothetical protein CDD81_196 [Ophiocordyceps australis]
MSATAQEERSLLHPETHAPDEALQHRVITTCVAMVILLDCAAFFMQGPQTNLLEQAICKRHYSFPFTPRDCTSGPVQAELATITQMLSTFDRIPSLIMSLPMGILADRYGRRPVLLLALLGSLLQDAVAKLVLWRSDVLPPRLIWLSPLAALVGGGDAVASSMLLLVVADVAAAGRRARLFYLMMACGLVGEVVATPLSAWLMARNPWIPYLMYTVLTLIGSAIPLFFLPETLPKMMFHAYEAEARQNQQGASKSTLSTMALRLQSFLKPNILAVLFAFFVSALGTQLTSFLLQYIRQRFYWTYQKVSLLAQLHTHDFANIPPG